MKPRGWLVCAIGLIASCISPTETQPDIRTGDVLRVLFVGNSLTYYNELPAIVEALADSAPVKALAWRMIAYPDYALEDHWSQGDALKEIRDGWDVVVLQQGPSSTTANRANLIEWSRRFNAEIRKTSGRPALYAVWPQVSRLQDLEASSVSYRLAADSVDGFLFPVSQAWRLTWERDPAAPLYDADGLHPTPVGSYLAALVIFQQLYNRSPVGLPAAVTLRTRGSPILSIAPARAAVLQEAAAAANIQYGRR